MRHEISAAGGDGFIVPLTDEHRSEYVGDYAQRLRWLTGFTGTAGAAVVLADRAALFTDGRYAIQARDEAGKLGIEICITPGQTLGQWLGANAPSEARIMYDPWLHTPAELSRIESELRRGARLIPAAFNLVDRVWSDRPSPPTALAEIHPVKFAGSTHDTKLKLIADCVRAVGASAVVITSLDSVAWALNLRGRDVRYTPVVRSFLVVDADAQAKLFVDPRKIGHDVRDHLGSAIELHDYQAFERALASLAGQRVMLDPETATAALYRALEGADVVEAQDPCVWPRAIKTPIETSGARAAHRRDGIALCRFLHWLETEGLDEGVDEIQASVQLESRRKTLNLYREPSFATISAAGPNAALPHYVAKQGAARRLTRGTLYLVDSGAQYEDGTTDVTRTVALGSPTEEMRKHFTLALKGHLAIASIRVPVGTSGRLLDPLARQHLWAAGLDYATGTGHGVGTCLSVHEGPVFIGRHGGTRPVDEPLKPDILLTVEPGLYLEGQYGIRTENLYLVVACTGADGGDGWLRFEPLTLAPIDRSLIDLCLLSPFERDWIDQYHARVLKEIGPDLDDDARGWLQRACAPL